MPWPTERPPKQVGTDLPGDPESALSTLIESGQLSRELAEMTRRSLERNRSRELLLRVLFETATDLAAITDYEQVLQTIVRRTRALLGSDMAYLSLNDYESGDTFIRTTDGVATEAYRNIRMPLGTGVLGRVAAGMAPVQTSDYLSDPEMIRYGDIDDVVRGEGVKAILGVPLKIRGKLMGALLVGNRHQHRFSPDDIYIVESIGSHAAVALDNAFRMQEMKELLRQRDETQHELDAQIRQLEYMTHRERLLTECVVSSNPLAELVTLLEHELGRPVALLEQSGSQIGGNFPEDLYWTSQNHLHKSIRRSFSEPAAESFILQESDRQYWLFPAMAANRALGGILVHAEITEQQRQLLTRSALVLSVILLLDETRFEADRRQQSELIDLLLAQTKDDSPQLLRRAAGFGLREGSQMNISVLNITALETQRTLKLIRQLLGDSSGLCSMKDGMVVVLSPNYNGDDINTFLSRHQIPATTGFATSPFEQKLLAATYKSAKGALDSLLALGLKNQAGNLESLGVTGMLFQIAPSGFGVDFLMNTLGPILDYDERRGTCLVDTAWHYLNNDGQHQPTAHALHVHPNTVRQRLGRIRQLLGNDWETGHRKVDVQIALRIWRIREFQGR